MRKLITSISTIAVLVTLGSVNAYAGGHSKKEHSKKGYYSTFLAEIDTNKDQKVSKKEFLAHATKSFSEMDQDKDGYLNKKEMKKHRKMHKKWKKYSEKGKYHQDHDDEYDSDDYKKNYKSKKYDREHNDDSRKSDKY